MMTRTKTFLAFSGRRLLKAGDLLTVAAKVKEALESEDAPMPLIFEEATGRQIDIDVRGSQADLEERFADDARAIPPEAAPAEPPKRGRPKLGVVGREVTLLPRHWQWLEGQRGGASAALRRLVDKARREHEQLDLVRLSQDRANRFMSAIAGDLAGFEEATRALYAGDRQRFVAETKNWPSDIKATALDFAKDALSKS
jgi:hypothetical protein